MQGSLTPCQDIKVENSREDLSNRWCRLHRLGSRAAHHLQHHRFGRQRRQADVRRQSRVAPVGRSERPLRLRTHRHL